MIALALSCALCGGEPGLTTRSESLRTLGEPAGPGLTLRLGWATVASAAIAPFQASDPLVERYYEGPPPPPWRRLLWVGAASALALGGSAAAGLPPGRGIRAVGLGFGLAAVGAGLGALGWAAMLSGAGSKDQLVGALAFGGPALALAGPVVGVVASEDSARHDITAHGRNAAIYGSLAGGVAAAVALLWNADLERAGFGWWVSVASAIALAMASGAVLGYALSEGRFAPNRARP